MQLVSRGPRRIKFHVPAAETQPFRTVCLAPALCTWGQRYFVSRTMQQFFAACYTLIQFNLRLSLSLSAINLHKSGSTNAGFQSNSVTKIYFSLHTQSSSLAGDGRADTQTAVFYHNNFTGRKKQSVSFGHGLQKALLKLLYAKENTSWVTFKINWFSPRKPYFIMQRDIQLWRLFIKKYQVLKKGRSWWQLREH